MAKNGINIRTGGTVCALRREQGLSQEELAFNAGLDVSTIGRIERGEMSPTLETLDVLSKALDVDVVSLFHAETDDGSGKAGTRHIFELLLRKTDAQTLKIISRFLEQLLEQLLEQTEDGKRRKKGKRRRKDERDR